MEDWVKIYTSTDIYSSERIKQLLEANHILVVCLNRKDSVYLFGEIELYITNSHFNIAIEIIISQDLGW